ncbi:MAG: ATP-binding protein [Phycisphaerae bacterium]|nr:ATP-binding protein [Phycisphaerae bacterium]
MFKVESATPRKLCVHMLASLENIDQADSAVSGFLIERKVPVDRFAVRIMLREALLNAVTHGSGGDSRLPVRLDVELGKSGVALAIEDTGEGFIWQDRDVSFDVLGDGGRGLALMQIYSSEMTFNESGNRVALRRNYDVPAVCHEGSSGD